ncbi:1-acyl-sn-glycerol-3-phosphate acyltransferase [uncultured Cohaesibacter sp.]|uniref:1-acyl-sn-glycerol-3-phosphate acyltransferase n=1 Tax=uncultured Cohaesibacter sp. TaxID=1002546 RepID=UPI00292F6727|nr:1-acyl-sn-glycerol-3-phosphate acyltransferase [uncultured Cohaesibacter sp.]
MGETLTRKSMRVINDGMNKAHSSFTARQTRRHLERTAHISSDVRELVDWYIEVRARHLVTGRFGPAYAPLIRKAVRYDNLCRLVSGWRYNESGIEMAEAMLRLMEPQVTTTGLERLPAHGGCLVATNHPTGLPDGLALFDQVREVRKDLALFVFADLLSINPNAADLMIPVEWRPHLRDRSAMRRTMAIAAEAFRNNRCVGIFPSGRLSYWNGWRLKERPWNSSFLRMAKKHDIPIVPGHIRARNSITFYALSQISTELRDIQSIRELQNKHGAKFHITFGEPIDPATLAGDQDEIARKMQSYVENDLPHHPDRVFDPSA